MGFPESEKAGFCSYCYRVIEIFTEIHGLAQLVVKHQIPNFSDYRGSVTLDPVISNSTFDNKNESNN